MTHSRSLPRGKSILRPPFGHFVRGLPLAVSTKYSGLVQAIRRLPRYAVKLAAFVYANPTATVPIMSMVSGILLSTGMSFLLMIVTADEIKRIGMVQIVGLTLVFISWAYAMVAWAAQQFQDYLRRGVDENKKPLDLLPNHERRGLFEGWNRRRHATWAMFLAFSLVVLMIGAVLIAGAVAHPNQVPPQKGLDHNLANLIPFWRQQCHIQ